ncbi:GH25 family lysozyme [Feifania hominis]|uniref:LysM peptidoglycan-binding domain-containing protein n=1 Tax=Feifania hominis TaxID=2763660 RepID=A0A926HTU7_9FIRM|nr:GH25 family lysozyme [Feifania hominis]MBC8535265.1 LysM peptidoglycan-binding domain-containing protein [Feifania hominis]
MHKSHRRALALLTMLCLTLSLALCAQALEPSGEPARRGIDVSEWQGSIDFARVRDAGIEIVYIRAGAGGDYADPDFRTNYENAKAAGLKIGFYHYVTARSSAEAEQQARYFVSLIGGTVPDCRLAMDFETFGSLSREQTNEIALVFLETVEQLTGKSTVVYTDAYNARAVWNDAVAERPLWVAQYGVDTPEDNGKWDSWVGFQYSDRGRVDGIRGNVDLDWFTDGILLGEQDEIPHTQHHILYRVRRGDTLWRIARRYGTTVEKLAELNHIADPNRIFVGQMLEIPSKSIVPVTYTVKRGDTLWGIARRYHTTVSQLAGINHIKNPNLIYVGQTIKI